MEWQIVCCAVTLLIINGAWQWAYKPDFQKQNWAKREALLVLREREAAGLPPIDRNFVDPKKIELLSDEELGDCEIII